MDSFIGMLRRGKATAGDYVRCLQTLLAGISRYTVDGRDEELAAFRESLLKLSFNVGEQSEPADIEKTVALALEHFRDYNDRSSKLNATHISELKSVMRTMTETITFLSESRTRSVHQLHFVEREMEQAVELEDIRLLRSKLIACLEIVREETVRLHQEAEARSDALVALMTQPVKTMEPTGRFGSLDAVTGLPGRKLAEQSIVEIFEKSQECAVALFVVNRMPGINARYGRAIGDEVMLRVANHFAQHLSSSTSLYRWSGPALVAVAEVREDYEELKRTWTKTASMKHELSLDAEQRSVFVVVETTINFYHVAAGTSFQKLFRTLDHAVAGYIEPDLVGQQ